MQHVRETIAELESPAFADKHTSEKRQLSFSSILRESVRA
jgi:hypothetical protein